MQTNGFNNDVLETKQDVNVNLGADQRQAISHGLSRYLADTHALHLKALNYHWHVKGMHFQTLHAFFQELYEDLHESMDEIAERVLQLGFKAPATPTAMNELSSIKPGKDDAPAEWMVEDLLHDYETTIGNMRDWRSTADEADDAATVAMFDDRLAVFEKYAWMMRSMLG